MSATSVEVTYANLEDAKFTEPVFVMSVWLYRIRWGWGSELWCTKLLPVRNPGEVPSELWT